MNLTQNTNARSTRGKCNKITPERVPHAGKYNTITPERVPRAENITQKRQSAFHARTFRRGKYNRITPERVPYAENITH